MDTGEDRRAGQSEMGAGLKSFASTHWSVVLAVSDPDPQQRAAALEQLCRTYWYPLYCYVRRRGNSREDAEDLTQAFFARLLEKHWLEGVEMNGTRFRCFLLSALNAFLANEHDRATAAKRGGGRRLLSIDAEEAERLYLLEPSVPETPETLFDQRWALTVLARALARLREELRAAARGRQFELLGPFLSWDAKAGEYAAVAAQLGTSSGAVAVAVHRLRERYRQLVRAEVTETVSDPRQVDDEMDSLFAALQGQN